MKISIDKLINEIDINVKKKYFGDGKSVYFIDNFLKFDNKEFIENLYFKILKREPEVTALKENLELFNNGANKSDLIKNIASSQEAKKCGTYVVGFEKNLEFKNLQSILDNLKNHNNILNENINILNFEEPVFITKEVYEINDFNKYHDTDFIYNAFIGILGRKPDENGFNYYLESLRNAKLTKTEILCALRFSEEGKEKNINILGLKKRRFIFRFFKIPVFGKISKYIYTLLTINKTINNMIKNEVDFNRKFQVIRTYSDYMKNELLKKDELILNLSKQNIENIEVLKTALLEISNNIVLPDYKNDIKHIINEINKKAEQFDLEELNQKVESKIEQSLLEQIVQDLNQKVESKIEQSQLEQIVQDLNQKVESKIEQSQLEQIVQEMNQKVESKIEQSQLEQIVQELNQKVESKIEQSQLEQIVQELNQKVESKIEQSQLEQIVQDLNQKVESKIERKDFEIYLQTVGYAKEYMKISQQNMQNLIDEAKKRLPEEVLNQNELLAISDEEKHIFDTFYVEFEDKFRGTREDIKNRVKVYLPYIEQLNFAKNDMNFLDVGCGRGEWLELLNDEGYKNTKGLDLNRVMVSKSQELGLDVIESDVIKYLLSLPDESLSVITGFHIIEHLPFEVLMNLFKESYRVLKKGGIVIFETPNPENLIVGACNFYTDPTHRNPLPPLIVEFIALNYKFKAEILRVNGNFGVYFDDLFINHQFASQLDYAIIGYKI